MSIIWGAFNKHCCTNSTSDLLNENFRVWGPEVDILTRSWTSEPLIPERDFLNHKYLQLKTLHSSPFSCGVMPKLLKVILEVSSLGDFSACVLPLIHRPLGNPLWKHVCFLQCVFIMHMPFLCQECYLSTLCLVNCSWRKF